MTISTTDSRKNYTGNGSTVAFSFPYKFLADADLYVYVDDVLQTLTTDYTVSGAGSDSGGTVTFVTAPASATRVTLVRATPLTQEVDYISGDSFPAETHESALDKNVMGLQDARESFLNRTVMLATSAEGSLTPISDTIAQRASKYISFNALGDIVLSTGTTSTIVHGTTGESLAGTQTPSAALTVLGLTATASELNIMDGVTATASELNIMDGVTATTAELNIMDGVTSTAAELNLLDGKSFLDEDTMSSDSATALASQQSIKAYVDTGIPRVSQRVCIWEGSNGTVANGIFSAPTVARQQYTMTPSSHFGLSSGTFLKLDMEWQCVNAEDGIAVGDVLPFDNTMHDGDETSYPIWYDNAGDMSNSSMRVKFNVGDYGGTTNIFHLWTRPGGSSADTWYQKANFALYARIYYTI